MACVEVELINEYIHTDGQQYVVPGNSWTIRATTDVHTEDETIYISYAGSTASIGSDFTGPSSVVLLAGKTYVDFEIDISIDYQCGVCGDTILIAAATAGIECCEARYVNILCEDVVIRIPGKDCCLFYDKVHEQWRDYYPTCMSDFALPKFIGNMLDDGSSSTYDWYDSELYI